MESMESMDIRHSCILIMSLKSLNYVFEIPDEAKLMPY